MLAAVEFDDECKFATGKVGKVRPYLKLTDELVLLQVSFAEQAPKPCLRVRGIETQYTRPFDEPPFRKRHAD